MSWSYSGSPGASSLDTVRFLVQDTDTNYQLVSNEEITWALTQYTNAYMAASLIAGVISRKYARLADKSVGDLSISYSSRARTYAELASDLAATSASAANVPTPYAGGISVADKETDEGDSDRVDPAFARRQFDDPSVGDYRAGITTRSQEG